MHAKDVRRTPGRSSPIRHIAPRFCAKVGRALKVFILAVVPDVIYQYLVLRWFYLREALIVAFIPALVPYLLIRGPVDRIARRG